MTKSLQGGLVAKGVLSRLGNKLETGVDGLDGLLGLLDGGHCKLRTGAKEEEQNFSQLDIKKDFRWLGYNQSLWNAALKMVFTKAPH